MAVKGGQFLVQTYESVYKVIPDFGNSPREVEISRDDVLARLHEQETSRQIVELSPPLIDKSDTLISRAKVAPSPRTRGVLHFAARFLPSEEREDWLAEQRCYLADLPNRRARCAWIVAQLNAMPRYTYTVRTGREKGPAA